MTDSLPDSDFNESGECSWCRSGYPNYRPLGPERLLERLQVECRPGSPADCVVGVSGGKDSCYVLHELVRTFGMRCIAFTYHHDGVAPFALQNARRVCEDLGVELHVCSLPGHTHVESFRTFFRAWANEPDPISAAMTCVACKHLHRFGNELAESRGVPMAVWANCPLEYSPFLAIKKKPDGVQREGLVVSGARLAGHMIHSPRLAAGVVQHFGLCLGGCLAFAPTSAYIRMRYRSVRQIVFFEYVPWNRQTILETLHRNTRWSVPDRVAGNDWHSDCLFNVFKEYMYQKTLGVSYTDGFLSNQIRHGLLGRDEAWGMLLESKRFFSEALPHALEAAGIQDLGSLVDAACFELADDEALAQKSVRVTGGTPP